VTKSRGDDEAEEVILDDAEALLGELILIYFAG
jgi:hypothetical protein